MKKYISMLAVCLAILSSCTNEDITFGSMVTVKVNPSGVIAPFVYELYPGELEGIDEPWKLRTRVLVYDEEGQLKASDTQYLSNYSNIMTSSLELAEGDYTAIAITDVVELSGSEIDFEFWNLSGENVLSQLKVTDTGYIGGGYKILGVGKQTLTVNERNDDVVIRCSPAGAICLVYYQNVHTFSDVVKYGILMTKSSDYISYNNYGDYEVSIQNNGGDFGWWLDNIEPDDYTVNNVYGYKFVLPMNNVVLKFIADTDDNRINLSDRITMNIEAGMQYLMMLNLNDEESDGKITSQFTELSNDYYAPQMRLLEHNARKVEAQMCNQSVYVKDLF